MSNHEQSGRTFGATLRHHGLLLLTICALASSAGFLLGPALQRSYSVQGQVAIQLHPLEALGDLRRIPKGVVQELTDRASKTGVNLSLDPATGETAIVRLSSAAPTRNTAVARIQQIGDEIGTRVKHRADELASSFRSELTKRNDRLTAAEEPLAKAIESFRLAHRGVLPDDPTSVVAQFEKLANRLDDKQQRERIVVEQLSKLEAYKRSANTGASAPPPPLAPAAVATGDAPAPRADSDPEVLSLNAQIQLVSDQLDDQLNNKHRTEQHPYVIDLRTQQADLQKKVDAAKARVAAGGAPPANVRPPQTGTGTDPTLANAQAVDLQMQALQAERDTLDADIKALSTERDRMQKKVDEVLPVRQEYEKLTAQLDAANKEHQTVTADAAQFDRMFPADADASTVLMDITPLSFAPDSTLPAFPKVPFVYAAAVLTAAVITVIVASVLHAMDQSLHSAQQAAAILELPILGEVIEIRPPGAAMRQRLWIVAIRPVLVLLILAVTLTSAVLCYRHLADSTFTNTFHERGLTALVATMVPPERGAE